MDSNQAETLWCKRIAEHLRNPRRFFVRVPGQFGQHELARLCVANISDLRVETRLLVDRL